MLAAASKRRMNETHKMIAFALLFIATLLHEGNFPRRLVPTIPAGVCLGSGSLAGGDKRTFICTGAVFPRIRDIYLKQLLRKSRSIIKDPTRAVHSLTIGQTVSEHGGVVAEYEVVTGPTRPVNDAGVIRGDDIDTTQQSDEEADTLFVQTIVFPSIPGLDLSYLSDILDDTTAAPVTEVVEETMREATGKAGEAATTDDDQETQAPQQILTYQSSDIVLIPEAGVMCVDKEAAQDRDAVSLKLKASSSCEETRSKIESVLEHLCGVDCKLEVFQEDNSNEILIFGQYIEADAQGMAEKFNNDNIKDKIDFEEAVPRWEKNSKLVLVSLLLTGLLLAILLIAGYYLKTHRPPPKGARLAEEGFQVDEENQANTLVSVAPLQPQKPLDKTPTNGHSATQTPVADTEM